MARIQKAYENKFRAMLGAVKTRQFDKAVDWFREKTGRLVRQEHLAPERAAAEVYEHSRQRLAHWRQTHPPRGKPRGEKPAQDSSSPQFWCDAGLGGLARWLRAAGYEANWKPDIEDDVLLQEAGRAGALLLTTDSMLMERRVLREGIIRALWVSPAMKTREQLQTVLRELNLPLRQPRCMACGGPLLAVSKEELCDRIPPKTYAWLSEFFVCQRCGKLFWHGTHWERIQLLLRQAESFS